MTIATGSPVATTPGCRGWMSRPINDMALHEVEALAVGMTTVAHRDES